VVYYDLGQTKAESSRQNEANFRPAEMGRGSEEEWSVERVASGEPTASHMATCGRPGPPERGGRGQETLAERGPAASHVATCGRPGPRNGVGGIGRPSTNECGERELAVMEKCQNKANLLVV
jgi:hypothetical protein